ncbi:hypothetical protein JN12_00544 [Geobacter argillaceus]|uniref:Uncharacterized protein n=1 Tax=Geobacter argillaceus TaxID=345631 RepID=A0A562WS86_9BACT|nr:hypothetical protein JN12_00544 [Geobacter argillaceus]
MGGLGCKGKKDPAPHQGEKGGPGSGVVETDLIDRLAQEGRDIVLVLLIREAGLAAIE